MTLKAQNFHLRVQNTLNRPYSKESQAMEEDPDGVQVDSQKEYTTSDAQSNSSFKWQLVVATSKKHHIKPPWRVSWKKFKPPKKYKDFMQNNSD